jgi:signal transduction histidine kinase
MKRVLLPYILLAIAAMFFLLLSQGIWIFGAVQQGDKNRKMEFQESFDRAVSFSIFRKESTSPFLEMTLATEEESALSTAPRINLGEINSYDNVGRMFEDALLLAYIEAGRIAMSYLDSLIQDRTKDLGSTASVRLVLYDTHNAAIDSVLHSSRFTRRLLSDKYVAERIAASPEKQYTIRAEYQIISQGFFRNTSIAVAVSVLASVVIVIALSLLSRILKRRHEELQEMQHSFHGAIHDLKSPLAYAYTSLTLLEETITDPKERIAISQSADNVSYLTDKITIMLQSSQDIKRVAESEREEVFLYDIVTQITTEIQALFSKKTISVENMTDVDFSFFAAPNLFEAVMRILIENAVRYNGDNPEIKITGFRTEKGIFIAVADNGIGISKRRLKNIFKPYHTSDKKNGTGIGLYYAHTIVKAHGGTLSVDSEEGKGSTFTIEMPFAARH